MDYHTKNKKENVNNMNDYRKMEKYFYKEFLFEQVVNVNELHLTPKKQKTVVTKTETIGGKTVLCKYEIGQYYTPTRYYLKCVAILDNFDLENKEFSVDTIMKFESDKGE